jgi:hypothetical protein
MTVSVTSESSFFTKPFRMPFPASLARLAITDTDWGECSWPWHMFALGKEDRPLIVTSNKHIPLKNTPERSAVVFCACETIELCSVASCVVRGVYKLHFEFVSIGIVNKLWPDDRRPYSDTESYLWCSLHVLASSDRHRENSTAFTVMKDSIWTL